MGHYPDVIASNTISPKLSQLTIRSFTQINGANKGTVIVTH